MFYNLGKRIFRFILDFVKFTQVFLIFLSFFVILYWLFQLGGATFVQFFAPFFESIKNFTHLFYNRVVTIDNISIDFSFLLDSFIFLGISWSLKYVIEVIERAERKYDDIYKYFRKKAEDLFNLGLQEQYYMSETTNKNLIMLVKFNAINLSKSSFFNKNVEVGVEEVQKKVLNDFLIEINKKFACEKELLKDGMLLHFNDFNKVDNNLLIIEDIIANLVQKYKDEKWHIDALISIDVYMKQKELTDKTADLIKMIKLGISNRIVCLGSFKQRYSFIKKPQYVIEGVGVYKINENEEIFCLRSLR